MREDIVVSGDMTAWESNRELDGAVVVDLHHETYPGWKHDFFLCMSQKGFPRQTEFCTPYNHYARGCHGMFVFRSHYGFRDAWMTIRPSSTGLRRLNAHSGSSHRDELAQDVFMYEVGRRNFTVLWS